MYVGSTFDECLNAQLDGLLCGAGDMIERFIRVAQRSWASDEEAEVSVVLRWFLDLWRSLVM